MYMLYELGRIRVSNIKHVTQSCMVAHITKLKLDSTRTSRPQCSENFSISQEGNENLTSARRP